MRFFLIINSDKTNYNKVTTYLESRAKHDNNYEKTINRY